MVCLTQTRDETNRRQETEETENAVSGEQLGQRRRWNGRPKVAPNDLFGVEQFLGDLFVCFELGGSPRYIIRRSRFGTQQRCEARLRVRAHQRT